MRDGALCVCKLGIEGVEFRAAHFCAPPDAGVLNNLLVGKHLGFSGGQAHGKLKIAAIVRSLERALDRLGAAVHKRCFHEEGGVGKILDVDHGLHKEVLDLDIRRGDEGDGAKDAHALVHRTGVPVNITVVEGLLGGLKNTHLEGVAALDLARNVKFTDDEGTNSCVRACQKLAVEPDVCAVAKAVEAKDVFAAGVGLELCSIDPGAVKLGFVYFLVVFPGIDVLSKQTGLVEGSGHSAGDGDFYAFGRTLAGKGPVRNLLRARVRACEQ